jgi:hypothetical protein
MAGWSTWVHGLVTDVFANVVEPGGQIIGGHLNKAPSQQSSLLGYQQENIRFREAPPKGVIPVAPKSDDMRVIILTKDIYHTVTETSTITMSYAHTRVSKPTDGTNLDDLD